METLCRCDIVNVDITKSLVRSYVGKVLATGDCNANKFGVNVFREGVPVALSGCSVLGYFIRPDMDTLVLQGVAEGNTAHVVLPQACYTAEGAFSLAIKISGNDTTHTVRVVDGQIRLTQTGKLVDPGEVVPSLDDLFAQIAAMEAATADTRQATAGAEAAAERAIQAAETAAPPIVLANTDGMVHITDAAERSVQAVQTVIEAAQSGTGNPSPDNVRPITGWDAVSVTRTGRNLLDASAWKTATYKGVTFTNNSDGSITVRGTNESTVVQNHPVAHKVKLYPGEYYINTYSTDSNVYSVLAYTVNGELNFKTGDGVVKISEAQNVTVYLQVKALATVDTVIRPMLSVGEVATEYEPYRGVSLTEALPDTVWGGTLDWATGVLTVTHKHMTLNGTEQWFERSKEIKGLNLADIKRESGSFATENAIADTLKTVSPSAMLNARYPYSICVQFDADRINVRLAGDETDTNVFKEKLAANPINIVYKLAAPYTIQITPQQLDMLKGDNNVWSDSGDTSMVYIADTKLYIDGKFAELYNAILAQGANI